MTWRYLIPIKIYLRLIDIYMLTDCNLTYLKLSEEKIDNICGKLTPTCPDDKKDMCKHILCEQIDGYTTPPIRAGVCGKITSHTDWE